MDILQGIIGMAGLIGITWLMSNNRKNVSWRLVGVGISIQFIFAVFILKGTQLAEWFAPLGWPLMLFDFLASFFVLVLDFTTEGAIFVFGDLALGPAAEGSLGFFFAFQVLPTIVFFASITTILYHYGILQFIVRYMAKGMQKLMGASGAESLSVTANIFVGQTESPLLIKPFIEKMTRSELLTVMSGGMATIAGGIMAAYIMILGDAYAIANEVAISVGRQLFAQQLLAASVMAAPAALVIAKILYPETEEPVTKGDVKMSVEQTEKNGIDAAASGASEGLKLSLNVGAMLLAFVALIAMFNYALGWFGEVTMLTHLFPDLDLTIQTILGWIFFPFAVLIGIPITDAADVGALLGIKVVLTEFLAFEGLSQFVAAQSLQPKTVAMATFALCGFANFASIAIQIGGIGGLAPNRKSELAEFGIKAVIAGTIANLMTATIAGILF
ncbi:MAG: NupC/NupG family nucleoside CNT transporter [Balneolaceae bacterium]